MARFEVPDGWTVQAFRFTLDATEDQSSMLARHFGARRKAYNWTVGTLKAVARHWCRTSQAIASGAAETLEHGQERRVCQR
jgi:putative transposase